ncbi:hypothetical protein MN116_008775 [Schistosoma mekongi]|uniref:Uncharacterized protein n=1 Tax=Schistosoma mekongi TaxID=38744 RepID=A0AAE1Z5D7_SCHME|nr:hypothetical protein MN116_008775 [Schistosoma mekongi]
MKMEATSNRKNIGQNINSHKSDVNRITIANLCGWSEDNAILVVYRKPVCRITGSNAVGGGGTGSYGKSERLTHQKASRVVKEYKFYHYDDPHAYVLQYRRDYTLISNSKDYNQNKGLLEEHSATSNTDMNPVENDTKLQKSNVSYPNNEILSELSFPEKITTTVASSLQPQSSELKVKSIKSTPATTTITTATINGNRHMWLNNCPTGPNRNNCQNKFSNTNISNTHGNQMKQRLTRKELIIEPNSHSIRSTSSKLSKPIDTLYTIKNSMKLNYTTNEMNRMNKQQTIHNANHPEFWSVLYQKLLQLQNERSAQFVNE